MNRRKFLAAAGVFLASPLGSVAKNVVTVGEIPVDFSTPGPNTVILFPGDFDDFLSDALTHYERSEFKGEWLK